MAQELGEITMMKFLLAMLVIFVMAALLILAVVAAAHGRVWWLLVCLALFVIGFSRIGCLGHGV